MPPPQAISDSSYRNLRQSFRVAAAGAIYILFGAGFLVFAASLSVVCLSTGDRDRRGALARSVLQKLLQSFRWIAEALRVLRTRIEWEHQLAHRADPDSAAILVANHPTIIDAVMILSFIPDCICVVKNTLTNVPLLAFMIRTLQYVPNEDAGEFMTIAKSHLDAGRKILIFPEGTRTRGGRLGRFTRGAAALAIRSACKVWPVIVRCEPTALEKGTAWWDIPVRTIDLTIRVCYPLNLHSMVRNPQEERPSAVEATGYLETFFASRASC